MSVLIIIHMHYHPGYLLSGNVSSPFRVYIKTRYAVKTQRTVRGLVNLLQTFTIGSSEVNSSVLRRDTKIFFEMHQQKQRIDYGTS